MLVLGLKSAHIFFFVVEYYFHHSGHTVEDPNVIPEILVLQDLQCNLFFKYMVTILWCSTTLTSYLTRWYTMNWYVQCTMYNVHRSPMIGPIGIPNSY